MKKTPRTLFKLMCATVVPTVLISSLYVHAEPGILQNVPFAAVSTSVQPNILFILDDSGSMNFEIVRRDGVDQDGLLDITPNDAGEMLESCFGFNTLAYDPTRRYLPWRGFDESPLVGTPQTGTAFTRQNPESARINPFSVSTNLLDNSDTVGGAFPFRTRTVGIVNLLTIQDDINSVTGKLGVAGYVPWNDADDDNEFDDGECARDGSTFVRVDSLPDERTATTPSTLINTQQNFATWYSFHRSRAFVAKSALLSIIERSRQRLGVVGLFNNVANGVLIRDIDNLRLPNGSREDTTRFNNAVVNKNALMRSVAESRSGGVTALASTLFQAGRYFSETAPIPNRFFDSGPSQPIHNTATDGTISNNSPILSAANGGTCQANFSILFTDGFANRGFSVERAVGNADSDSNVGNALNTSFDGGNFADGFSGTLADVAMFYLERDLAPSLTDNNGVRDIRVSGDTIEHQHMSTYTVGFGVAGTLSGDPSPTDTSFAWPKPNDLSPTSIDDLRHAAWNGRGSFLEIGEADNLEEELTSVFSDIEARRTERTTAASSVSSGFVQEGGLAFQAEFDSQAFTGNLFAFAFDADGLIQTDNRIFDVAEELNEQVLSDNGIASIGSTENTPGFTSTRNIITKKIKLEDLATRNNTATTLQTGPGVAFALSELSISQQRVFTSARSTFVAWDGTDNTAFGGALINYIKGDSTNELNNSDDPTLNSGEPDGESAFRNRQRNYLGAIINSSPQFVGVPNEPYPDQIEGSEPAELYSSFQTAQINRTPIVYIGANDGMLHGFNASVNTTISTDVDGNQVTTVDGITGVSGSEVFAYIPATLTRELPQLAQPNFVFDSFVDATPTIRDVYVNADGTGDAWRTYLVSGLRNGSRSIYALDVTDPASTFSNGLSANARANEIARFEYTHPDLGFTYSRPQIARMNDGSWVAVVGNGYNSVGDGRAKLFIIDLESGLPLANAGPTGSNGIFDTGVGTIINNLCIGAGSDCNGLSEPTIVDLNGDFITDRIYAGDLHGNVWVFNVQSATPSEWTMTRLFTATQSNCTVGGTTDCRQPITTRPVVTLHPSRRSFNTEPNLLVLFGSGQFIAEGDASNTENQTFYSVWDTTGTSGTITNNNLTKADLVSRTFGGTIDNITITGDPTSYNPVAVPANPPTIPVAIPANFGWYIDLAGDFGGTTTDPFDGGRVSINPIVSGSVVFFVTTVPSAAVACVPGEVSGLLSALDVESGQTPSFAVFVDEDNNPLSSSTIVLNRGAVGFNLDTTRDGPQTRLTNIDGSITQGRVSTVIDIPIGRKAWSILR